MTHATRLQRQSHLSVRTRALIQKLHQRLLLARGLVKMRLCARSFRCTNRHPSINTRSSSICQDTVESSADCNTSDLPSSVIQGESSSTSSAYSTDTNGSSVCKWEGCDAMVEPLQLIQHLQQMHVLPQLISNRRKCFMCLWKDCRVFRQPSVSSTWLENHILDHTEAKGKPFRCIFDGCNLHFSTSTLLERHLQRLHMFSSREQAAKAINSAQTRLVQSIGVSSKYATPDNSKSLSSSPKNGKRMLRKRKRPRCYRVRRTDFLDHRTHCVIQNRLRLLRYISKPERCPAAVVRDVITQPFPKPLVRANRSKIRLRSLQTSNSERPVVASSDNSASMRTNRAMLLTTPYRLLGQRISDDGRTTEYLVHWVHPSGLSSPTWITQNHFPNSPNPAI